MMDKNTIFILSICFQLYHHCADVVTVLVPLDGGHVVDDADVHVGGWGTLFSLKTKIIINLQAKLNFRTEMQKNNSNELLYYFI
jgi:hypothetical protein